jgi:hypothetical protein
MQETGNKKKTDSIKTLSIFSNPDGFTFFESSQGKHQTYKLKIEAPVDFPESFETFVSDHGWASDESLSVRITEHSDRFMLLPVEITDQKQIHTFFDFIHTHINGNVLQTKPLCDGKQIFCYDISSGRLSCYKHIFPEFELNNNAFALTEWTFNNAAERQGTTFVAYLSGKSMQLFAANASGLLFANSFHIQSSSETTYFFLRSMEQLGLDPFETKCMICADPEKASQFINSLRPYIQNLEMATFTFQAENCLQPVNN